MNSDELDEDQPWGAHRNPRGRWTWHEWLCLVVFIAVVAWIVMAVVGCTVTPATVRAAAPSLDGNAQNSGFLGWTSDGYGIITAEAGSRYHALRLAYGGAFMPALKDDVGLTLMAGGTFLIDKEHLARFGEMATMARSGSPHQPP